LGLQDAIQGGYGGRRQWRSGLLRGQRCDRLEGLLNIRSNHIVRPLSKQTCGFIEIVTTWHLPGALQRFEGCPRVVWLLTLVTIVRIASILGFTRAVVGVIALRQHDLHLWGPGRRGRRRQNLLVALASPSMHHDKTVPGSLWWTNDNLGLRRQYLELR